VEQHGRADSFPARVGAALGAVAAWCHRRFVVAGLAVAIVVGIATWLSGRLAVDPDITRLLPRDVPSVKAVEALRDRFGGVGYVVLMIEGGTAEERRAFADGITPKLAELESVRDVDARRPVEFFADRALYFVDESDLALLRDRIAARKKWEVEKQTIGLDDGPAPPVETADIEARVRAKLDGAGRGVARSSPYYEDEAGRVLAVFVRPTALASDLAFAKRVVADVEGVVAKAAPGASGLSVELTGRYKKRVDLQTLLTKDVAFTSGLAMALIVLYVAIHFRRLLAAVLVLAPLYAGLAVAYGVAAVTFGTLNVLSAFIGAILIGIGIDNGIHLLGRIEEERAAGKPMDQAIRTAFATAGRVSLGAALTSASAFACLAWTDFRAFREFGTLAAVGLLVVLVAYVVVLPTLLGLFGRLGWGLTVKASVGLPFARHFVRFAPAVAWVAALAVFGMVTNAPQVKFDADFSHLDDADLPSFHRDKEVNALLGRSQTPLVVLAPTDAAAREVAEVVRTQQRSLGDAATIGTVSTVGDLVPPDQIAKQARLREIAALLAKVRPSALDAETRERVERLRTMAAAEPFGPGDLPPSVRQLFATKPGAEEVHLVLLFPSVGMGDAAAIARLADQVREIRLPSGGTLGAAGEPLVMADVLSTVRRDAPRIFIATLVMVVASLILSLGRVRLALLALAPAVLSILATFGLLPMLGIELNYLNMIVLPILLGIGVDDGAHIVARLDAGEPLIDVWRHTGWDVTGAILTDVFGFGVIAFAAHPGLASLGKVALVGLFVNFFAAVILLPAMVAALGLIPAVAARPHGGWSGLVSKVVSAGHTPVGPGTVGALAALPLAWGLAGAPLWMRLAGAAVVSGVGLVAVRVYLRDRPSAKDPQEIVVDETAGCLIALVCVPFELPWIAAAFVLFRLLDIFKPGPIRWIDKHVKGSLGVMGDDVAAGVIAGAGLWIARIVLH
jgi:predicted RND superfamily exporter protein/phosphatidylglycerophosphatase A